MSTHWNYDSRDDTLGPANWGRITEEYHKCYTGREQAPVNIELPSTYNSNTAELEPISVSSNLDSVRQRRYSTVYEDHTLKPILFNYRRSNASKFDRDGDEEDAPARSTHHQHPWKQTGDIDHIYNNGHTEQVSYEHGSSIYVDGIDYQLIQFHFHSPSEHTINERHYAMEMHLVHQQRDNPEKLAVVAVFLATPPAGSDRYDDDEHHHHAFNAVDEQTSAEQIPAQLREKRARTDRSHHTHEHTRSDGSDVLSDGVDLDAGDNLFLSSLGFDDLPRESGREHDVDGVINIFEALPIDLAYWHYNGSLTTPPCTEGVSWYVMKEPVAMSERQRRSFVDVFGRNARPTQPLNRRSIAATPSSPFDDVILIGSTAISQDTFIGVVGTLVAISLLLLFAFIFTKRRDNTKLSIQRQYDMWQSSRRAAATDVATSKAGQRQSSAHSRTSINRHDNDIYGDQSSLVTTDLENGFKSSRASGGSGRARAAAARRPTNNELLADDSDDDSPLLDSEFSDHKARTPDPANMMNRQSGLSSLPHNHSARQLATSSRMAGYISSFSTSPDLRLTSAPKEYGALD